MDSGSSTLKRPPEDDPVIVANRVHLLPITDTPLSENTVHEHRSTPGMTSQTTEEVEMHYRTHRKQGIMRECLLKDLHGGTHESEPLDRILCPDNGRTGVIVEALQQQRWVEAYNGFVRLRDWPQDSDTNESNYSRAFTNFLNAIIDNFKAHFPLAKSYWKDRNLRFYPYDKEMKEEVEFVAPLKPDFLAVPDTIGPFDSSNCSWLDAEILGEMKASWNSMTIQAASYARCAFAAANHRIFVPVFCFHYKNAILRLAFFHRGGLLATQEIHLARIQGFTHFVSIVVGMLSWANPTEAGYQRGQSHSDFKFNDHLYRIDDLLCHRLGIRGRATHVYKLSLAAHQPVEEVIQPRTSNALGPLSRSIPIAPEDTQLTMASLPATFVLKCSHPLASLPKEETIFATGKGFIGIVDISAAYDADSVCTPSDATFWDVFGEARTPEPKPEHRLQRRILFTTVGRSIFEARGPQELGYAILHTMIGHCALFTVGNYLHRDISSGNILLLPREEAREIPPCLEGIVDSGRCVAVLIDGDVTRAWGDTRESDAHRSGTKPFLSIRLLEKWFQLLDITHTPIDDLESFIWVLVFILLSISAERTQTEELWLERLQADNLSDVTLTKGLIMNAFVDDPSSSQRRSKHLTTFGPLLNKWLDLAAIFKKKLGRLSSTAEMKELSLKAYKEYVKVGLEYIPSLPLDWVFTDD